MDTIREKLALAKRPLILAGHGVRVSNQVKEFRSWIDKAGIPVVTTQLAKDLLPYQHDLYIGSPGVKGDRAGGLAVQNADVILIIGSSLHPTTTGYEKELFAPNAYKIQVDIDQTVLKKNANIVNHVGIHSIQEFLKELVLPIHSDDSWRNQCRKWKHLYHLGFESNRTPKDTQINYYDVIDLLSQLAPGDATIIADAGSAFYITGQAFRTKPDQRVILPGGLAQMGYATGAMIGASFADRDKMVIGLIGDGSIMTNIHDLAVMNHHELNTKLFLLNNHGYACIRNTQDRYFKGHYSGVDELSGVSFPSFRQIAYSFGIHYAWADHTKNFKEKLIPILQMKGPVLFEIHTKIVQEIQPVVQSEIMPDGTMKSHGLDEMYPYLNTDSISEATLSGSV